VTRSDMAEAARLLRAVLELVDRGDLGRGFAGCGWSGASDRRGRVRARSSPSVDFSAQPIDVNERFVQVV